MSRWLEVTLPTEPNHLDILTARLVAEGFESFQVVDPRELDAARPIWELFDEEILSGEGCAVKLYLRPDEDIAKLRVLVPGLSVRERDEEDWADAWKQYYKPTPIGDRLLIQPAWLPLENPEGRAVFLNNPGMSFGTGLHASTRLCLELLEPAQPSRKKVLDIGCGSGILGLCALKLGAASAVGIDIDPGASVTAKENAVLNGLEDRYIAFPGDFLSGEFPLSDKQYDIVFTNIVADVIIPLAPLIPGILAPDGAWIVSGVIGQRLGDVLSAAKNAGFSAETTRLRDGWAAVCFR
ncbi:MAG: 50S ribosomal protein L11 methyltransferase [Oscillospiraceae bacterium]|jgi:ribosomal protein L11 methyltransferase|nr:50S ribosomal protein L11 methyltransferase [Oscillospiraceae bacterium]